MTSPAVSIAKNEFYRVAANPVSIVVGLILITIYVLNAAGGAQNLANLSISRNADGFFFGYQMMSYITNEVCSIMAVFLGVMAISDDRSKGLFSILAGKPLYRRDILIGKFAGLSLFLLTFLTVLTLFNASVLTCFYGSPVYTGDFVVRTISYIIILALTLMIDLGAAMLIGVLFKHFLVAVSVAVTYLSFQWFWNSGISFLYLKSNLQIPVAPYMLTGMIFGIIGPDKGYNLFDTNTSFFFWMNSVRPEIGLMLLIIITILLANCLAFSKEDV
ncbi:ABC transporter permease [Methanocella sp. MCL-LM]|uniref:ABC transporter permease n=1 Tax=Methanocella sp. MCL-LM TaxID=3412035 RepID=UPI003C74F0C2